MIGIVFPSAAAAAANGLRTAYDARLGYPRPGVDVGGGRHVSAAQSTTATCSATFTHPSLPQIALQESDEMIAAEGVVGIGAGSKQTLDPTWFPAPP